MKRRTTDILFLLCLLLVPFSCSEKIERTGTPVSFRQLGAATRAGARYIDNSQTASIPSGTSLKMWAWLGNEATGEPDFMNNQMVTNEGGSAQGSFVYTPPKYWPTGGTPLSFFATWPYDCNGLVFSVTNDEPGFEYTSPALAADQADLLACKRENVTMPAGGTVGLRFSHILSKVSVSAYTDSQFAADGMLARIESVELENVSSKGTYMLDGGWTSVSVPVTYACGLSGADGDVLLLIPQETGGMRFKVTYSVALLGDQGQTLSSQTYVSYAGISGTSSFEPSGNYAFTFVLRETRVELSLTVLPWELDENTYDYSTEVTLADNGLLSWQSGTYSSMNSSTFRIVSKFGTDFEADFEIATPAGAVWYALLDTVSGNTGAFVFVDGESNLSASATGPVGEPAHIRIRQTDNYPSSTNSAVLSIVVRAAGRTIPVTGIVDNLGHKWTIIQNANN